LVLFASPRTHRPEACPATIVTKPVRGSKLQEALVSILRPVEPRTASLVKLASAVGPAPTAGGKILVAEDNAVNQKLVRKLVEKLGYESEVVENGELAVQAAKRGGYSAILMDCMMPVLDGYQATGRIRRFKGPEAAVPVIALTASALKGDREKCLGAGMSDYLTKPLRIDDLRLALERWCGKTHVPVESVEAGGLDAISEI
jgi:CheY-like chemotaxis protein